MYFPLIFLEKLSPTTSPETPAECAAKKLVVTVEKTIIRSPTTPRPARREICAISEVPIPIAADIPIIYIQQLTSP